MVVDYVQQLDEVVCLVVVFVVVDYVGCFWVVVQFVEQGFQVGFGWQQVGCWGLFLLGVFGVDEMCVGDMFFGVVGGIGQVDQDQFGCVQVWCEIVGFDY